MIKIAVAFLICLSVKISALKVEPPTCHSQALKNQGFLEIGHSDLLQEDYQRLYESFERLICLMTEDEAFFQRMRSVEREFLSSEALKSRYCGTPPSYRDPAKDSQKRHNKIYFQFIKEHYDLLKEHHPQLFEQCADFFEEMRHLDQTAKTVFATILETLAPGSPGIKEALLGKHQELTVVSKIVRYKRTDHWGTTPHFDKSALSLIWDSSDANYDSLVLCPNTLEPSVDELEKPARKFTHDQGVNSVLLIPGACLPETGIDVLPTLHGVLPIKQDYRYAVISFVLVPDMDTTGIVTDFVAKQ